MLSELYAHIHQTPPPSDKVHVEATLKYLEACNQLFERGFLSHDRIMSMDSEIIQNITQGFKFFSAWIDEIIKKSKDHVPMGTVFYYYASIIKLLSDPKYPITSPKQRNFLSWQSKLHKK